MAANSSPTSKSRSDVSYLQIYWRWLNKDQEVNNFNWTIPVETILIKLTIGKVLDRTDYDLVKNEGTRDEKMLKLFLEILPSKDELGFDLLVKILFATKCNRLANDLNELMRKEQADYSNDPTGDIIPKKKICLRNQTSSLQNPQMKLAQAHLSRFIKDNGDFMSKYWSDVILAQTKAAFVQVQVLEDVGSYREMFGEDGKTIHERILIQADPGCGKTTYVNKLALDWANEDEYLREKFDFVFLIPLQTLTMDVFDAMKCFLPKQSESFFNSYAESAESKILLILDGFDELVESSQWYTSVMNILEGKSMQLQLFHLIVTTRRSHVEKIPQHCRGRSLLITGFDEESMKQFLDKQSVKLPSVGQQSNLNCLLQQANLSRLLQTPLFCAIYCSLHIDGADSIELEDSYDLIKAFVKNSVANTAKKKTVANEEEQLNEIGKFAFQMLDYSSLNFLKMFCRTYEMIMPCADLTSVNLDLIKRRIPIRDVDSFEEFSLPHHLIAEYLAAKYFVRSLTEQQLKQAEDSAFTTSPHYPSYLNLPFVRFFLFELNANQQFGEQSNSV